MLLAVLAVFLIAIAWVIVLGWYLIFGIFLIPYRLIRRGSRKRKRDALQHREMIAAIQGQRPRRATIRPDSARLPLNRHQSASTRQDLSAQAAGSVHAAFSKKPGVTVKWGCAA